MKLDYSDEKGLWKRSENFLEGDIRVIASIYECGLIKISFIFPIVCGCLTNILNKKIESHRPLTIDETLYLTLLPSTMQPHYLHIGSKEISLIDLNYQYLSKVLEELGFVSSFDDLILNSKFVKPRHFRSIFVWRTEQKYRLIENMIREHSPEIRALLGNDPRWQKRTKGWIYPVVSEWFCESKFHFFISHTNTHLDINFDPDHVILSKFGFDSRYIFVHDIAEVGIHSIALLNEILRRRIESYQFQNIEIPLTEVFSLYRTSVSLLENIFYIEDQFSNAILREYFRFKHANNLQRIFLNSLNRRQSVLEELGHKRLTLLRPLLEEVVEKTPESMREEKKKIRTILSKIIKWRGYTFRSTSIK